MKNAKVKSIIGELKDTEDNNNITNKYGIPAVMVFQFHLIEQLDDCCKWMHANFKPDDMCFNVTLKAKL